MLSHKKDNKQILKNYGPISLLPISAKIFERIIYNKIFEYLIENNLITENHSGFKPGDSFIDQHLSVTHDIYKSFDGGFEVEGVFLDTSKAFNKVWHEGLIYKNRMKTKWNIRKAFKYNKRFLRLKKTESGTKREIFILGKYYSRDASKVQL